MYAFTDDSLTEGHISYVAAQKIESTNNSQPLKISVSGWNLSSLDGLTIKVWMEDPNPNTSGSNSSRLAAATNPITFVGSGGSISGPLTDTEEDQPTLKTMRVFAMKEDLQCSWG